MPHTEITLQHVLIGAYSLRLFVEDEEIKLLSTDNQIWTPAQRPYVLWLPSILTHQTISARRNVSSSSQIRIEIQRRIVFAKKKHTGGCDLIELFNKYLESKADELTVLGQS